MKTLEWPGIATAVAILLLGAITLDLHKWQPTFAAIIALGGGTLAYKGAMAKVEYDREQARDERINERLGLLLRLQHSVAKLCFRSTALIDFYDKTRRSENPDDWRIMEASFMDLGSVPDLEEAWQHLQMIPTDMITPLAILHDKLPELAEQFKNFDGKQIWKVGLFHGLDQQASIYMDGCRIAQSAAADCLQALDRQIREYQAAITDRS